jgi:hypothetical protein
MIGYLNLLPTKYVVSVKECQYVTLPAHVCLIPIPTSSMLFKLPHCFSNVLPYRLWSTLKDPPTKTRQRGNNDFAGRVPPPLPTELLVLALTVDALRKSSRSSMVRHGVPSSVNSQAATSSFHSPFSSFAKGRKSASFLVYMSGRRIEDTLGVLARPEAGCDWRSALSRANAL